ncbi:C-X-C motif chemokine 13-like isoform X2 [Dendropsophus ebraccatus]|uniref:C-X-C motif chemokine 13-like isoform X2 n=1 Tax=Dendropsophus ebraccatus TaxID=150705 RepID=UPI0038321460
MSGSREPQKQAGERTGAIEKPPPVRKCLCYRTRLEPIPKSAITKIVLMPPGDKCPKLEAIITTKKKHMICVDPEAKWFKNLLPNIKLLPKQK